MDVVVAAIDGPESERALPAATELAERYLARIVVVHVNQLTVAGPRGGRFPLRADEDQVQARIRELVRGLQASGYDAELEIHTSSLRHPAAVIADVARRHGAGAIVVATSGRSPLLGALTGSVAHRLLRDAPCPVVAVTPEQRSTTPRVIGRSSPAAA
jgi:nucleotide-binding universal stress UspA family protein